MQMVGTEAGDLVARKQVRDYFREVSEHCKLPPPSRGGGDRPPTYSRSRCRLSQACPYPLR